MNIFLFFLIISQSFFSYFLFTKIRQLQKEKEVEPKPGDIVLSKLKEMPTIENIDPDSKLLQDIIESAKLEGWIPDIQEEGGFGRTWRIEIQNPSNTLTIRTVLRIYDDERDKEPIVGYFNVGDIGYDCKENPVQRYLVIQYLWSLILEQNEKEYQATWNSYLQDKEKVENCLTALKRDRQLKKLFDKDLADSK
jgi:hypothetical protein